MFNEKFWLAIAFALFVGLIVKYVWPIIAKMLDQSSKKIAEDLLAAKEMKERAERLLQNAEQFYKESVAYAEKLTADATLEAQKIAEKSKADLEAEIAKKTAATMQRIKIEEERAIREIKLQVIDGAIDQISNDSSLKNEQEKLIENSIKHLESIQ